MRWLAEPVRSVIVPADVFLTNKKGFPVRFLGEQNFFPSLVRFANISAAS
ncbi:prmt5 [Symbiodinium sp. CCMP2592]|nr:prmt5 [Symbiodinium sp. CCMP2592]